METLPFPSPLGEQKFQFRGPVRLQDRDTPAYLRFGSTLCLRPPAPPPVLTSQIKLIRSWQRRPRWCQGVNKFQPSASCQPPAPKGGPFQAKIVIRLVTSIRIPFTLLRSISSIISMAAASGNCQDHSALAPLCSPPQLLPVSRDGFAAS